MVEKQHKCPVCASETRFIGVSKFLGKPRNNVTCSDCGVIFRDYIPTEDEIKIYYEHYVANESFSKDRAERLAEFISREINPDKMSKILDIGAGSGFLVKSLRQRGFINSTGLEPSEDARKEAKEQLGIDIASGFIEDIANLGSQNMIIMSHVLEHILPPLENVLDKISNVLLMGGYLILVQLEQSSEVQIVDSPVGFIPCSVTLRNGHFWSFSDKSIKIMAEKSGFSFEKSIFFNQSSIKKQSEAEKSLGENIKSALLHYHILGKSGKALFRACASWINSTSWAIYNQKIKRILDTSPQILYLLKKQ